MNARRATRATLAMVLALGLALLPASPTWAEEALEQATEVQEATQAEADEILEVAQPSSDEGDAAAQATADEAQAQAAAEAEAEQPLGAMPEGTDTLAVSGTILASDLEAGTILELSGDTTLQMDQDLTLKSILGSSYALTVTGTGKLTVNADEQGLDALVVASLDCQTKIGRAHV